MRTEPEAVADPVRRHAERYERTPAPTPDRGVIGIAVDRAPGRAGTRTRTAPGRRGHTREKHNGAIVFRSRWRRCVGE
ncbi:hypothetical protein [Streptomyces sp. NPDC006510]|uniref:hypothetical protein n=1 Tax=Streptomyces sp. NPDC006510 TaxID=3155600 RepID=UPI0033A696EE